MYKCSKNDNECVRRNKIHLLSFENWNKQMLECGFQQYGMEPVKIWEDFHAIKWAQNRVQVYSIIYPNSLLLSTILITILNRKGTLINVNFVLLEFLIIVFSCAIVDKGTDIFYYFIENKNSSTCDICCNEGCNFHGVRCKNGGCGDCLKNRLSGSHAVPFVNIC